MKQWRANHPERARAPKPRSAPQQKKSIWQRLFS